HGEHPREHDVEAVAVLALGDDGSAGRDFLAPHALRELAERLAGERREQSDPRQLVQGGSDGAWHGSPRGDVRRLEAVSAVRQSAYARLGGRRVWSVWVLPVRALS